jgi:hypothetical protein
MSRLFRSRRRRKAGHMALWGKREIHTEFWLGNPKESDHLKDLDIKRAIILKLMLKKWDGRVWTVFIWIRVRTNGRLLSRWQ